MTTSLLIASKKSFYFVYWYSIKINIFYLPQTIFSLVYENTQEVPLLKFAYNNYNYNYYYYPHHQPNKCSFIFLYVKYFHPCRYKMAFCTWCNLRILVMHTKSCRNLKIQFYIWLIIRTCMLSVSFVPWMLFVWM